jgi:hypothetical protein
VRYIFFDEKIPSTRSLDERPGSLYEPKRATVVSKKVILFRSMVTAAIVESRLTDECDEAGRCTYGPYGAFGACEVHAPLRFRRFSTILGNSSAGIPTKISSSLTFIDLLAPISPKL